MRHFYEEAAFRTVKKEKRFYKHFGTWLIFSVFFILLNYFTSRGEFWAIYPIMGWGVGVASHALGVFGLPGFGKSWEAKRYEKEMERYRKLMNEDESDYMEDAPPLPSGYDKESIKDRLELKEIRKVPKPYNDSDLV